MKYWTPLEEARLEQWRQACDLAELRRVHQRVLAAFDALVDDNIRLRKELDAY